MTHADLDRLAARAIFTTDLPQNYVALTEPERDALVALAREGLAAREMGNPVHHCERCGRYWQFTHPCPSPATRPTSGPDGV